PRVGGALPAGASPLRDGLPAGRRGDLRADFLDAGPAPHPAAAGITHRAHPDRRRDSLRVHPPASTQPRQAAGADSGCPAALAAEAHHPRAIARHAGGEHHRAPERARNRAPSRAGAGAGSHRGEAVMSLFEGKLVRLTQISRENLPVYKRWFRDYETQRLLGQMPVPVTDEFEEDWYDAMSRRTGRGEVYSFSIRTLADDELIGNCSLFDVNHK